LLEGWGRADSVVAAFLDEIASWDDKRLNNLAALLPKIIANFDVCRARLLSLAKTLQNARFDLIALGCADLGCAADDARWSTFFSLRSASALRLSILAKPS
jgi:hypothetical protein